jgi:hypothetical protein
MLSQWSSSGAAMWFILPLILSRVVMSDKIFTYAFHTRPLKRTVGLPDNDSDCESCSQFSGALQQCMALIRGNAPIRTRRSSKAKAQDMVGGALCQPRRWRQLAA